MKGQAVFEFIVAAVLFFAIVIYVIVFLSSSVGSYSESSRYNNMQSQAFGIADYLATVELPGKWPVLSDKKIQAFHDQCNAKIAGYIQKYDLGNNRMKVVITEGRDVRANCPKNIEVPNRDFVRAERYGLNEDGNATVNINVTVWSP